MDSRTARLLLGVLLAAIVPSCGGGGGSSGAPPPPPPPPPLGSFSPPWAGVAPTRTLNISATGNAIPDGAALAAAIAALVPGDELLIGPGTYSVNGFWSVDLAGTAAAPIWITGASGGPRPVLTRPDALENVLNVGAGGGPARYLCIRNLEITGGDSLVRLHDCRNVWIDQCYIHDGDGVGITANSADTSLLYITRNEIARPGGAGSTGEGMYLGANASAVRMTNSVIALNVVHDTFGTLQGDGIEVKQGSYGNFISANTVYNTNYPCILVGGTDGLGLNVVERNTCWSSNDYALQVQGEAIVRNNLVMDGAAAAFATVQQAGPTVNLEVTHNTFINSGRATNLSNWSGQPGLVFANNACYSQTAEAIRFPGGSAGVAFAGNVAYGSVVGAPGPTVPGNGLADFLDVAWDASRRDARPAAASPLVGAGSAAYAAAEDLTGGARAAPLDAGCYDRP